MYNGYVKKLTPQALAINNYHVCCELAEDENEYWMNRKNSARVEFDELAGVDVDAFLHVMAALDGTPEAAEFVDDWAGDPEWLDYQDLRDTQEDARQVGLQ